MIGLNQVANLLGLSAAGGDAPAIGQGNYGKWPMSKFSFRVNIGGMSGVISFETMDGLGATVAKMEYRDGNSKLFYKQHRPTLTSYDPVTLKKGLFEGDSGLYDWFTNVSTGSFFGDSREVTIELTEVGGAMGDHLSVLFTWTLHKAYVTKFTPPSLDGGDDSSPAVEELEIAYQSFSSSSRANMGHTNSFVLPPRVDLTKKLQDTSADQAAINAARDAERAERLAAQKALQEAAAAEKAEKDAANDADREENKAERLAENKAAQEAAAAEKAEKDAENDADREEDKAERLAEQKAENEENAKEKEAKDEANDKAREEDRAEREKAEDEPKEEEKEKPAVDTPESGPGLKADLSQSDALEVGGDGGLKADLSQSDAHQDDDDSTDKVDLTQEAEMKDNSTDKVDLTKELEDREIKENAEAVVTDKLDADLSQSEHHADEDNSDDEKVDLTKELIDRSEEEAAINAAREAAKEERREKQLKEQEERDAARAEKEAENEAKQEEQRKALDDAIEGEDD